MVIWRGLVAASLVWAAPGLLAQQVSVERVSWLQGCWRSTEGQTTIEEQWMAPRGGSMLGMSRTVRGAETTAYELVMITVKDDRLAYQAHPSGQAEATFLSTTASESSVVFENPQHDFPQRVGYRRDGTDGLQAWVEGTANGRSRRIDFPYRRVRCEGPQGGAR